ncbi:MAG: hypothetical protein LUD18_03225 [Lachnospiraceae bacterium]|nr:hypothetical protein [Lachnospiraceae bacterium]
MKGRLPLSYDNYIFDLYGTLVDIHTDENLPELWKKLSLFYGYYGAHYTPDELRMAWNMLTDQYRQEAETAASKQASLEMAVRPNCATAQKQGKREKEKYPFRAAQGYEASPEIDITRVIQALYSLKGVSASQELAVHTGQFFRVLSTEYIRLYDGTVPMLEELRANGKKSGFSRTHSASLPNMNSACWTLSAILTAS